MNYRSTNFFNPRFGKKTRNDFNKQRPANFIDWIFGPGFGNGLGGGLFSPEFGSFLGSLLRSLFGLKSAGNLPRYNSRKIPRRNRR
ncbi:hypothetical protein [Phosphitispora sp. TUW77]|uniref:hypothetical protein n=1 Tax=Phosphitispora sp. TUW77 TaxID=3152361 RepID=UPI003AB4427A